MRINDYADCSGQGQVDPSKECPHKTECWRYLLWTERKAWPGKLGPVAHADFASDWENCEEGNAE